MSALEDQGQPNETREVFRASGEAPDVLAADAQAWAALESVLGLDPVKAWTLTDIVHAYLPPDEAEGRKFPSVAWSAEWVRNQEVVAPRSEAEAEYLRGETEEERS